MDEFNNNNNNGQYGYDPNLYGQPVQPMQPPMTTYGDPSQTFQDMPDMGNAKENKGMSIASLVCGILSLLACFSKGYIMLILAICAIVFGVIGRKKGAKSLGTAGMVCGIISLVIFALLVLLVFVLGIAMYSNSTTGVI